MKRIMAVLLVFAFVAVLAAPVYADAGDKLKGGVEKLFKSPTHIPNSISDEYEAAEFKPFGVFGGLFKGLFYTGKDIVTGLFDILTFPIDFDGGGGE